MVRIPMILVALALILSLPCISLMADEDTEEHSGVEQTQGSVERDHDRDERVEHEDNTSQQTKGIYDWLLAELDRQREEIHALREEIRDLREEMVHLLSDQLERRWEETDSLRIMLEEQHNFLRGMVEADREFRLQELMRMREWELEGEEHNIERELRDIQEEVERNPNNPELRVRLGHVYREVDNIEAAFEQYKAALAIAPDFEPAFHALEELRTQFPDVSRRPAEKPLEDATGKVVSASKEEVKLEIFEGDAVTFKVPSIQKDDGSWVLNADLSEFTGDLQPGMRVRILWRKTERSRIIHRIERLEDEE